MEDRMRKLLVSAGLFIAVTLLVTFAVWSPAPLGAQSSYGSIVGTVTDISGAIVPGATVTVTNLGTGEVQTTTSDQSGNFSVVNLNPANYKVDVQKTNFKRFERQPVEVAVGATVRVNSALQVGAATETVEITTQTPLLQTDSGTLSTEVEGKTVDEMPLNGRNSMNLVALAAGVVPQGSTEGSTGMNQGTHTNWQGWDNYQIGGSLAGENSVYLDGAPNNTLGGNTISMIITQDAVQEFNVTSNSQTADYGRNGGAVINMATKGGTNSLHGSVYEYIRNTVLNANDFFNKQSELSSGEKNKPLQWNQDQYGVAVGGPVKKDKLFFHFTWERFYEDTAKPGPGLVPTTAQVNGQAVPAAAEAVLTGALAPYNTCAFTNNGNGTYAITNMWTAGCGDPLAKIIGGPKGYYPAPSPGYNPGNGNNFYIAPASSDTQQQYNGRGDWVLSSKQRVFGRYTYWRLKDTGQANLGDANGWHDQNAATASYAHQAVLGDTYTFSPTTVLDVRLSYLRHNDFDSLPGSIGTFQDSVFGGTYYTTVASEMGEHVLPNFGFNGSPTNYDSDFAMTFFSGYWFNTYAIVPNLTKIVGNHDIKVGAELRLMQSTNQGGGGPAINSGTFNFTGGFTGDAWTDFLLGYVYNGGGQNANPGSLGVTRAVTNYSYYQAYYVTDTWNATHKLTVTAGVRYELPGGIYERHGYNTVLLPNYNWTTPGGVAVTGALGLVNSPLYNSGTVINTHDDLFAPRLGLAYRLANDTAVRAGYGIDYLAVDTTGNAMAQNSGINDASTNCGSTKPSVEGQEIPDPNEMMYNCFALAGSTSGVGTPLVLPIGRTLNGGPLVTYLNDLASTSNSLSGPLPNQKVPYQQQWNLSFSHQLKGDTMVELGYAGAKGTHLPGLGSNFNQIPDSIWRGNAGVDATLNNSAYCAKTGTTIAIGQCDRPYPWYGNVADTIIYTASTSYEALQAKAEKRFKSGGTIMANYTWAKIIGDTDSSVGTYLESSSGVRGPSGGSIQDYDNIRAERSVLAYNVPQRAVISYVLNLPFGHGQLWGSNATGTLDHLISGWGVNGITTFQKGFHLEIGDQVIHGPGGNADASTYGFGSLRPNYTPGCNKMGGVTGSYASRVIAGQSQFNTGCWTQPADWTVGSEPRVDPNMFAEGIDNFDFTAMKTTNVTERINLQFKAEFFNLFNRIQFAPPGAVLGQTNGPVNAFGQVFGDANQPRLLQLSLRANF
jgi:hypothetical protein